MQTKYLALDVGTTSLGIAYSDVLGIIHGVENFKFNKNQFIVARQHFKDVATRMGLKDVVVGLPCYPSGDPSPMTEIVKRFVEDLEKENPDITFIFEDEQYTTNEAHDELSSRKVSSKKRKASVDKIAACFILEHYLQRKGLY